MPEQKQSILGNIWGDHLVRTKKFKSGSGLGPRYGIKVRKLALEVERKLRHKYKCPSCGAMKVKRVSTSIWQCKRCKIKFAGAAYLPSVLATVEKAGPTEAEGRADV